MKKTVRKNYESDFSLEITLPEEVGDSDFRLEFYTRNSAIHYRASRENGYLTPNLHDLGGGRYLVVLRHHGLGQGRLNVKAYYRLENSYSPDRHIVEVVPTHTDIELWSGASDEIETGVLALPTTVEFANLTDTIAFVTTSGSRYRFKVGNFSSEESGYGYGEYYYEAEGVGAFDELSETEQ